MRGKRTRWIKDLVIGEDPSLLITMRNYYGQKTEHFDDAKLYRKAKELYSRAVPERKTWGKEFKNMKSIEIKKQVKTEEIKNANNNSNVIQ